MAKLNVRWFGWTRALLAFTKLNRTARSCAAAPTVRPPATPPQPDFTVRVSVHGIDFIPRPEVAR